MEVLEITADQFKERQKSFLEMADRGSQIVITRRSKQSYILTPLNRDEYEDAEEDYVDDNFMVTPELLAKLDNIRQRVNNGEYTECKTVDEALKHLELL